MDFITGRTGSPHVTSQQFRGILEGIYGSDSYLAGIYDNLAYSIQPANTIQISSGLLIHHGGAFLVPNGSVDEVVYENGTQGTKRIDLIVARYTKDAETDTESAAWVIIKGTETTGTPVAPAYTVGNMQNGDLVDDCPVYAVNFDGLNITGLDLLVQTSGVSVANTLGAGAHNAIYRGANLGSTVTANQWAAIKAGTFDNLYIGDYWTINDVNWRIAGFDYYTGVTNVNGVHHVVIVPDTVLYQAQMNTTGTTSGGYAGSALHTTGLNQAKSLINTAFGEEHIFLHGLYLSTEVTDAHPSEIAFINITVEVMNEQMVYGCPIMQAVSTGDPVVSCQRVAKSQLPLFRFDLSKLNIGEGYWLRDIVSVSAFAGVGPSGAGGFYNASTQLGVRPSFSIYQA